jgi:hypothetical protein
MRTSSFVAASENKDQRTNGHDQKKCLPGQVAASFFGIERRLELSALNGSKDLRFGHVRTGQGFVIGRHARIVYPSAIFDADAP